MDKDKLLALAERCEAATGPDRELDWAIIMAVHPGAKSHPSARLGRELFVLGDGHFRFSDFRYTASLDAAMTLVPEGHDSWSLLKWPRDEGASFKAGVSWTEITRHKKPQPYTKHQPRVRRAEAATPALALAAAALRSHAQKEEG